MFCILIRYLCYFTRPTLFNRPTTLPSKPSARFQEWQSRSTREELHEALDYVSSLVMFLKKRKETVPHSTSVSFVTVSFRFFFFARTTRLSLIKRKLVFGVVLYLSLSRWQRWDDMTSLARLSLEPSARILKNDKGSTEQLAIVSLTAPGAPLGHRDLTERLS